MEYTLKLSAEDIQLLDEALVQLPYGKVAALIDKLNQQIVEQEQLIEQEQHQSNIIVDEEGNKQMLLNKNTKE